MAKLYYQEDCKLELLKEKTVAIVGYGSQGRAHALNLKESGVDVVVGLYEGSKSWAKAELDGFRVMTTKAATQASDIIMILANDEKQAALYKESVAPALTAGKYMAFAHGFNIHYGQIVPPEDVNVFMIAPKGPGPILRSLYQDGKGIPCLVAVQQDPSGDTKDVALAYAAGIGGARAGVIETTFQEETETDLFGEQAVLCGGLTMLMKNGFETLINAGYQPEIAYFECIHEMKLVVDLIYEGGFNHMRRVVSDTAEYGDYVAGSRVVTDAARGGMEELLSEIQDGTFARNWLLENACNRPYFNAKRRMESEQQLENVGAELRQMMSWVKK